MLDGASKATVRNRSPSTARRLDDTVRGTLRGSRMRDEPRFAAAKHPTGPNTAPCPPRSNVVGTSPHEFTKERIVDAVHAFFQSNTQYYIAGRYGAFAALNPVAGNLMHHAIEHFLKGGLAKTKSLEDLAKRPFGHNLPAIWDAFKTQVNDSNLAQFDSVITFMSSKNSGIPTPSWSKECSAPST